MIGSAKRRAQRSENAPSGPITKAPAKSLRGERIVCCRPELAERHPPLFIKPGQRLDCAMDEDRLVISGIAQEADDPLCLAQGIGADQMCSFRELADRGDQPSDLDIGVRVTKYRQAEGRLADKDIAGDRYKAGASRIGLALVIAGDDDPGAASLDHDLSRTENMAGWLEPDSDAGERQMRSVSDRLLRLGVAGAIAGVHDCQGFRRRQHRAMPGASVVGMTVGDKRPLDRARRVDVEIADWAIESGGTGMEQIFGVHRRILGHRPAGASRPGHAALGVAPLLKTPKSAAASAALRSCSGTPISRTVRAIRARALR